MDIIHMMSSFSLSEEETGLVEVCDTDITDGIHECENGLYGKIFSDRDININIKGLKSAMMHA